MDPQEVKVFILAAGLGSRLQPLTNSVPKALLHFEGKPMLEHVIAKLKKSGFRKLVINLHHHADRIEQWLEDNACFDMEIEFSDERKLLMDTGGAIFHAREFLEGEHPFLIYNVDIMSDIDLLKILSFHSEKRALATLAVKERTTSRNLLFTSEQLLAGWRNNSSGEVISVPGKDPEIARAFSGIHVLSQDIFKHHEHKKPFSIVQLYLELAAQHKIMAFDHSDSAWTDMALPNYHF